MLKFADLPAAPAASRRGFLLGAAAVGGSFVLGFSLPGKALAQAKGPVSPFGGYVVIAPDGKVTVLAAHMEMGQGIHHGIGTLVAEELGVPLAQVMVEGGAGSIPLYGNLAMGGAFQLTGGSTGAPSSWDRYRKAGATAREMLRMAAAEAWNVPLDKVTAADGRLAAPGKTASYGEMAAAAAKLAPPADVALKSPDQWTLIGKDQTTRIAGREKVTGAQLYTIDVQLPGMLTAVIAHPPRFGAKVRAFDAGSARQMKGIVDIVQVSRGVAVVAENMWAAIKGREALTIDWDESGAETRGTAELIAAYRTQLDEPGLTAASRGDAAKALADGGKLVEATYEFPYLAHAALEPLNAVVRREGDLLEVWGGHQLPDLYQQTAAAIAGLKPEQVKLHVMTTGGGFGRRAVPDADIIVEAVEIGKAIGWRAPVKLQWTREDDMAGGRYRPLYLHRVKAAVGKDGRIAAWHHRIVGQSILAGSPFEATMTKGGLDETSVEGASDLAYTVPNLHVAVSNAKAGVPVLWWRSVGHTHTAYAVETMMDALAEAAGQDPIAFRLAHLPEGARERGVLELARDKAGWTTPAAAGVHRGVAVHKSFNSYVAMVAEVTMPDPRTVKVKRVIAAVDCGVPINPDVIRAQVEGGIGFGLGAALHSELTLTDGKVDQANYDSFQILRLEDMPQVEVHIVASAASPTGIGEPGVPPIAPAVANAIAAAGGKRIATLPIMKALSA